jgi:hypothetical protein
MGGPSNYLRAQNPQQGEHLIREGQKKRLDFQAHFLSIEMQTAMPCPSTDAGQLSKQGRRHNRSPIYYISSSHSNTRASGDNFQTNKIRVESNTLARHTVSNRSKSISYLRESSSNTTSASIIKKKAQSV